MAKKRDDPRQVGRGVLIDVESALRPPEKIGLGRKRESQHEYRFCEYRQIGDELRSAIADEFNRTLVITIIPIEQCDEWSGVDEDA